jgi:hypothetical protein
MRRRANRCAISTWIDAEDVPGSRPDHGWMVPAGMILTGVILAAQ